LLQVQPSATIGSIHDCGVPRSRRREAGDPVAGDDDDENSEDDSEGGDYEETGEYEETDDCDS